MTPPTPLTTSKPTFWRIQNIQTSERDAAEQWLLAQTKELDISEGRGFSLASDGQRTLCATLTSHERPRPGNRGWRVDNDFIGFTPLSDPEDANVDIVIVTGLGGHALGSFRSADGTTAWLRDFAPVDIPRARFVTYGYDTAVAVSDSNQGVHELAQTFLDGLAGFRQRTHTPQRPLVFVCHSLGGVVLKEALVISSKATDKKHKKLLDIVTVTYGLIFMGVPNLGLKHSRLGAIVQGRPNEGFIKDLLVRRDGEASQFLSYLTNEFSDLDKRRRLAFEIVSYYETVSSPTVVDLGDGRFVTEGPRELMVARMSAERIGHYVRNVDHLSSNTDHRGLVRFEHSSDGRYRSLLDKLNAMALEAPQALQTWARSGYFGGELQSSQCIMPLAYLPFSRNRKFVGRTQELESLQRKLFRDRDCEKMAVVGLGGIGKTQTVLHFAYSVLDEHSDVSVFWVPVLSSETFEQAYGEIARLLKLPCDVGGKDDIRKLVRQHLSSREAGRWLMIVDNADDMGILEGSTEKEGVLSYLPESELGSMVFTTRDSEIAQSLTGSNLIELAKMTRSEAVEVLEKTLIRKDALRDEAATALLLAELDYLPVALTQATAYVNCNKILLSAYLDLLRSTEENKVHILSREMRDHTRYKQASNAVAKTWLVSFKQLVQRNKNAADLLRYMSCIEWKAIPRSILPSVEPAARMTEAIGALSSYSFITTRDDEETYDMHRLVHVAARVWAREEGMMVEAQRLAVQHLSDIFPSGGYEDRDVWRAFTPHAAYMRACQNDERSEAWANLCVKVGQCFQVDGRTREAVGWLEDLYDQRSGLPVDDFRMLSTQHQLACAYRANGQVKQAVQLLKHVVAIWEQVLAEDHPSRLTSQHELARAYQANGRVKDAIQLLEHVVAIEKRVLAEDHPFRLASQHELARAYRANRQVKNAAQLLEHVVAIWERVRAEDHPSRLASQHELASTYQANGQGNDAVQLLQHVVAIRERVLKEDHPDRLASQHNLARAYQANGRVKDAIQLLEHVVAIRERVLQEDHPDQLASQHNLAYAYQANGQVRDTIQLLEHVVAIRERVLAEDHPSRLGSQYELARAYKANGQVKDAVRLLENVVAIEERVLEEDHPDRLASQHALKSVSEINRKSHLVLLLAPDSVYK